MSVATAGIEVLDPATGRPCGSVAANGQAELDQAVARAQEALVDWRRDEGARKAALVQAGKAVLSATDEIAAALTLEQGKPLHEAVEEVRGTAGWLLYYGKLDVPREVLADDARTHAEVVRHPVGVVGGITPWNFPLMLASFKIAPALRAGCTMVLKPASYTPLSSVLLGEVLDRVLPPGVLQVLPGRGSFGSAMTRHPGLRKISFTGSTETGKLIAAEAAGDLKRLTLELGGNDAAVVLDDVDVERTAKQVFDLAFTNAGQVCCTIKRVYVPRAMHDAFVEVLAERAGGRRVGPGVEEGVQMGPVNNADQRDLVDQLVQDALAGGARLAAGGHALDREGFFYAPTIVGNARQDSGLVQEEQFGPALPVVPYDRLDEAIAMANGTRFGLSGSVWGGEQAASVAARLECGTAWVNTHLAIRPNAPFSGWKTSGLGVENGIRGLESFCELQVVHQELGA